MSEDSPKPTERKSVDYLHDEQLRRCADDNGCGRMTMRDIREFVSRNPDLPDDTGVVIHRVEDRYFNDHGWCVIDTLFEGRIYKGTMHNDYVNGIPAFSMYVTQTKNKNKVVLVTPHY